MARRWLRIPLRLLERYFSDGVSHAAAELSFFLLFSLFPLLMVLNALLGFVNIPDTVLFEVTELLPDDVNAIIFGYLDYIASSNTVPSLLFGVGLVLYSLSRVVRSLMYSLCRIYRDRGHRRGVQGFIVSVLMTGGFLCLLAASLFLAVAGMQLLEFINRWLPRLKYNAELVHSMGVPLAVCVIFVFLLLCYRLLPPVHTSFRQAVPGAVFSLLFWMVLTRGFSFYVEHIGRYSLIYGSIGTLIVMMLWLYLTSTTLVMGGVLNHVLLEEHQKKSRRPENRVDE